MIVFEIEQLIMFVYFVIVYLINLLIFVFNIWYNIEGIFVENLEVN